MRDGPVNPKEIGSVIPSVYYDLIARVVPGVPFALMLGTTYADKTECLHHFVGEGGLILIVLLIAYLIGLVLTTVSGLLGEPIRWAIGRIGDFGLGKGFMPILNRISERSDRVGLKDREAGATLAKMGAEAILCENLLAGFVFVRLAGIWYTKLPMSQLPPLQSLSLVVLLLVAAIQRTYAYLFRQKTMYNSLCASDNGVSRPPCT